MASPAKQLKTDNLGNQYGRVKPKKKTTTPKKKTIVKKFNKVKPASRSGKKKPLLVAQRGKLRPSGIRTKPNKTVKDGSQGLRKSVPTGAATGRKKKPLLVAQRGTLAKDQPAPPMAGLSKPNPRPTPKSKKLKDVKVPKVPVIAKKKKVKKTVKKKVGNTVKKVVNTVKKVANTIREANDTPNKRARSNNNRTTAQLKAELQLARTKKKGRKRSSKLTDKIKKVNSKYNG